MALIYYLLFIINFGFVIEGSLIEKSQLECEYYNVTECIQKGECETTKKQCDSEKDHTNYCYVVWAEDETTGFHNISLKSCMPHRESCNQTECVAYPEKNAKFYFCCCASNLCNVNETWVLTATTKATEIEESPKNENSFIIVAYVVSVLVIIILAIILGVYIYKKKKQGMFDQVPMIEPELSGSSPILNIRPIQLIEMKARGRFGAVWHALLKSEEIAVKIFPMQDKDSWITEQDIYKLPRMKHPNILDFIGAEKHIEKVHQEFWLITAYHSFGSLCDYLKAHTVTWIELCRIAESMSRGLMHLHEEIPASKTEELKPAIAHRDFKSKNVLLKSDLTACIADFGLAMVFEPGKPCGDTHGQVGTRRYMAPEVLEGAINFTRDAFLRIDIYACGLVLWEMVTRCTVDGVFASEYTQPFEIELGVHPSLEQMQENVVMKKLRPKIHDSWRKHPGLSAICDTMEECWDHDAEARLSSSCVMERISQHIRYPTTKLLIETNTNNAIKSSRDAV